MVKKDEYVKKVMPFWLDLTMPETQKWSITNAGLGM